MSAFLSWTDASGRPRFLYFDLTLNQVIDANQQVTDYAVEKGANVTDHSRAMPAQVTLEVMVSNAPIYDLPDGSRNIQRVSVPLRVQETALGGVFYDKFSADQFREADYVRETHEILTQLRLEATLLEVSTDYGAFSPMLIQGVGIQDGEDNGDAGVFNIRLKEVRIAVGQEVNAPAIPVAKKPVAKGKQDPKADTTGAGKQQSVLKGLTDMLPDNVKGALPFL